MISASTRGLDRRHGLAAACGLLLALFLVAGAPGSARALSTPALLDTLQHSSFNYFWNEANPANGLVKDRSTGGSACSIAATGFGLSAICIGIDHGWVTRDAGRDRVLAALNTFWNGPQGTAAIGVIGYQGFFYHFLNMGTATRAGSCELSSIDTALLIAGILDAKQYFSTSDPLDVQVRTLADSIYQRVDWDWMRNGAFTLKMGWLPSSGFASFGNWVGYNEAMILYILALGSPTHAVPTTAWNVWVSGYQWGTYYGQSYVTFAPLFGHQYSHCWVDFRYIQDAYMRFRGITYFENSRRATLAAQTYGIANPGGWTGYGEFEWGLTASDDPISGYIAHGAPPAQNDDGTITPTAAASSIAFAPEIVIPTLHHFFDAYWAQLWGPYGFKDAFNRTLNWWDTDVLGIDQGPIIMMIENYRNRGVWARVSRDADIQNGLARAGFTRTVGVAEGGGRPDAIALAQNSPNPFQGSARIAYRLEQDGPVLLRLFDLRGRVVRTLVDGAVPAGDHTVVVDGNGLASGVYYYQLRAHGQQVLKACIIVK